MGSILTISDTLQSTPVQADVLAAKYASERSKRLSPGGCLEHDGSHVDSDILQYLRKDPRSQYSAREPIRGAARVVIVGAGIAGLIAAVKLKEQGVDDFVMIEKGGSYGGTWYWNQYPGLACDVEALIYLPFLEETGYVPKTRYPLAKDIRAHLTRIVEKWNLLPQIILGTSTTAMSWDEPARRWHITTNRSDQWTSQFVVLATGLFHEPKIPQIPGIETFQGAHFHSGRWDYQLTGGDAYSPRDRLAGKSVGVMGTGASAVQIIPQLARDAQKLYVFQRTPSSITLRDDVPVEATTIATWPRGWQKTRMEDFSRIVQGEELSQKPCSATEGFDALALRNILRDYLHEASLAEIQDLLPRLFQEADYRLMDRIRKTVETIVQDPATAEDLKPWYGFLCKRPAFNNQYLATFNQPNVQLVDTQGKGVSRLIPKGVEVNGREFEVDVLIYCTGFDYEIGTSFYDRTGIDLTGSQGQTLDSEWAVDGPSTLYGIHVRHFPNLFYMGPVQAGASFNYTHTAYEAAAHIAALIRHCVDHEHDFQAIQPTQEAQEDWVQQNEAGSDERLRFAQSCTPGYFNGQGKPDRISARWSYYPKGIAAWVHAMQASREGGKLTGFETW
ncbi:cyclohexanone monooxygenase [Penicillium taxi]|uniref:cyclohexanone monooxygenase n=1 Tax=Penicillium taxi TaxID=168475 RepID=UPI0025453716|nr:cyclohexanone monooxygenase [Penicillium taxi]KAJ5895357.1 cyclohexanone monooxygenase [Penicillium taxi]